MSIAISGSSITFPDQTQMSTAVGGSFRNRIINGDMRIAQRGTSTALAAGSSNGLSVDRFWGFNIGAGACSIIQASTVPSSANGFINSLQIDVTTADTSIAAADLYMVRQTIEGLNISDLAWGTANAKTLTLSFWVRSSKTGTHFVAFKNYDQNRCYAASYTVSATDTWEQKTITVAGDTTGTWLTNNSGGIQVVWCLAVGSNFQTATANVWAAGDGYATSAQVNVMDSTANDFYITGVQLEQGSTATEFERRPYGTELALCQRYYEVYYQDSGGAWPVAAYYNVSNYWTYWAFKVEKRAQATVTKIGGVWGGGSTPTIYGGISSASFSATGVFALNAALNVAGLAANSEL